MKVLTGTDARWEPAGPDHFTGDVRMASLSAPDNPDGLVVLGVEFAAGARTDWHHHPGGQTLYVLEGPCLVANEDGQAVLVGPGDTVTIPPGELHWHGAESAMMRHLSLTSHGMTVWQDRKVTDTEYRRAIDGVHP